MGNAINAKGTIAAVGNTTPIPEDPQTDTYIDLCNVSSIDFSGETTDEIDTTTLCDAARTFITGFTDYGTVTLNGNYLPGDEGQIRLKELKDESLVGNFRITLPDDGYGNGEVEMYFKASVLNITPAIAVGAAVTFSASLRVSGTITEVLPTPPEPDPEP